MLWHCVMVTQLCGEQRNTLQTYGPRPAASKARKSFKEQDFWQQRKEPIMDSRMANRELNCKEETLLSYLPDRDVVSKGQTAAKLFSPLGQIPLTQMFSLQTDMQLINPATGLVPSIQILPMTLADTNIAQQVSPQMLPIIVAQIGAQGALLSSEELPMTPQIFTGLLIQPFGTGAMLPTGQERIDANTQDTALPVGQIGGNPAFWETPEGQFPTPSGPDDVFEATVPVGIQRPTEGSTMKAPNGTD
uniref:Amelotin n=1 Tax=Vombatus ursinus TaxID=29139 RepID=A0A4X2KNT1_VOMUR